MRKRFFSVCFCCLLLVFTTAAGTRAQLPGVIEHAYIPFDFIVRGKTLPAGDYSIRRINDGPEALGMAASDNHGNVVFETEPVQARRAPNRGRLVFHRYGNTYFLYEVWTGGEYIGRELPISRAERVVRREFNAMKAENPETVDIALN